VGGRSKKEEAEERVQWRRGIWRIIDGGACGAVNNTAAAVLQETW
jgi:hypothetical protein